MNKKDIAFLLCLFLGLFGVHKFYEHKIGIGIVYLLTAGIFGIGWIVDIVRYIREKTSLNLSFKIILTVLVFLFVYIPLGSSDTETEVVEEPEVVQEEVVEEPEVVQEEVVEEPEIIEEEVVEEEPETMEDIFLSYGVPENKINEVMQILESIAGNSNYIIELYDSNITDGTGQFTINISQSDSWLSDGISVNLTIADGNIYLANSGDVQLYNRDEGGLKISYAEMVLTDEEEANFRMIAEYAMTNMAQNPGTVQFSWFTDKNITKRRKDEVLVQGVMTCQNGLGLTLKYLYQVELSYSTGEIIDIAYQQIS